MHAHYIYALNSAPRTKGQKAARAYLEVQSARLATAYAWRHERPLVGKFINLAAVFQPFQRALAEAFEHTNARTVALADSSATLAQIESLPAPQVVQSDRRLS